MDQLSFRERQGRCLHQVVADAAGEIGEGGRGVEQVMQPVRTVGDGSLQASGELGQSLQAIGDGHQITGAGMAGTCPASQPFEITHRPQQLTDREPQLALVHQGAHQILALLDGAAVHQGGFEPAAQAATTHGGKGAIEGPEQ